MSEEVNTTPAPGLTLPDDAAPLSQVATTDRLLAFDASGEPVTATAGQVSDYVQGQIPYVGENLISRSIVGASLLSPDWPHLVTWNPLYEALVPGQTYVYSTDMPIKTAAVADRYGLGTNPQTIEAGIPFVALSASKSIYVAGTNGSNIGTHLKLERGKKATPWIPAATDMAVTPDYTSLTEQLVPGEFWLCANGVSRQVYVRTFRGSFTNSSSRIELLSGIDEVNFIHGYANMRNVYHMPPNAIFPSDSGDYTNLMSDWLVYVASGTIYIAYPKDSREFENASYVITLKYTKA